MNPKSLSVAYAVRRKAKGLGPIPATKTPEEAFAPAVDAQATDTIEENQEPSTPQPQSALDKVMAKHRPTFQRLADDES